ncbi:MAG: hypothetical protein ACI841_000364, partial [Planctomycetota bacterium]
SRTQVLDDGVYWTEPVLLDGLIYCRSSLGILSLRDQRLVQGSADRLASEGAGSSDDPRLASTLLGRHITAIGGEAAWRANSSISLKGDIEILGAGITRTPMTTSRKAPSAWHLSYSLSRYGQVQRCFDGAVGWQIDPFYGNHIEDDVARTMKRRLPLAAWILIRKTEKGD